MSTTNETTTKPSMAAYIMAEGDKKLKVAPAPIPKLLDDNIIIETRAVGINPVDYAIQDMGTRLFPGMHYPLILGFDVAGIVHSVGSKVTRFKVGDRVLGMSADESCLRAVKDPKVYEDSAFRSHSLVSENLASHVPSSMTFEQACTFPMGVSVAATGLFAEEYLALPLPTLDSKDKDEWVIVTGGSTCIGACGVQLAVNAGYKVISTSSPANFDKVKSIGAAHVIDYKRDFDDQKKEMIDLLTGKHIVGAMAIGSISDPASGVEKLCAEVLGALPKPPSIKRKFVACVSQPAPEEYQEVEAGFVMGASLKATPLGNAIFGDFLPAALEKGLVKAFPPPLIVGQGLEEIQIGLDTSRKGVSAKKVVVSV